MGSSSCGLLGFPDDSVVKESPCQCKKHKRRRLDSWLEDPMEKEMATYSSILAGKSPWTEKPSGLWSMGLQRDGHDFATEDDEII